MALQELFRFSFNSKNFSIIVSVDYRRLPSIQIIYIFLLELNRFPELSRTISLFRGTLVPEVFFSLGATELSRDCESRSDEKKTSDTNG